MGWGLFVVAVIIAASTASALLAYLVFNRGLPPSPRVTSEPVPARPPAAEKAEAAEPPPLGPTLDVGEFVVNLAPGPGLAVRYARLTLVVEVDRRESVGELQRRLPQVRDTVIALFNTKRFEELTARDGLDRLRRELAEALSKLVPKGRVVNVYFVDFVVQ